MNYLRSSAFFLILISCIFLSAAFNIVLAKDETAHLEFRKTAASLSKKRPYVVKKGEWLFDILRTQVGITSGRYTIIKALNPQIKDIDKIEPGDVIYLPDIDPRGEGSMNYIIKKGDSITRIVIRHLQVNSSELHKTINLIKRLNPYIKNYDLIYPGHALQLPRKEILLGKQEDRGSEAETLFQIKDDPKEKQAILPALHLAIVGHVINRMNGTLLTAGKYYIPLPQARQVTIACSTIPVVELDDGSVIFLDFADRIPDALNTIIKANWKNYTFLKVNSLEGTAAILMKIIDTSNAYAMTKSTNPLIVGEFPRTTIAVDWLITKKNPSDKSYSQGLSFIRDISHLLPRNLIVYAEKHGLIVTEILDGQGVISAPVEQYTMPQLSTLSSGTNIELADALLILLGYSTAKDSEIVADEKGKDNFNLSMKTDLLAKKGNKNVAVFHSRKISQQYIDNLKNSGTEVALFEDGEPLKSVIGKILQAAKIPFSYETFLFSFPEKTSYPKGTISFPAFKIAQDKGYIYLTESDIDRDIYGLLNNKSGVTIVKY
jgi:hypothetical protein